MRDGEIVCLYGLMGAGRTEMLEALAGRLPLLAGEVRSRASRCASESIAERIALGLALVPEDRQRDGLVQTMSVGHNLSLASAPRRSCAGSSVRDARSGRRSMPACATCASRPAGPRASITSLSGGNQQKVVIGKVLLTEPEVLLLDEPTRGIDVGAKAEIFALMAREARRGLAVLFATSEVGEALNAVQPHRSSCRRAASSANSTPAPPTVTSVMVASGETAAKKEPRHERRISPKPRPTSGNRRRRPILLEGVRSSR